MLQQRTGMIREQANKNAKDETKKIVKVFSIDNIELR